MGTVHVVPLHDQVQHTVPGLLLTEWEQRHPRPCWLTVQVHAEDEDRACACGTTTELVPNDHGPDGWVITHHSLDGREQHE